MKRSPMKLLAAWLVLTLVVPSPALAIGLVAAVDSVSVTVSGLRPNRTTNTVDALAKLTNTAGQTLVGPLYLGLPLIAPSGVTLAQAAGTLPDGTPYLAVPLPAGGLAPGQSVSDLPVRFSAQPANFTTTVYQEVPATELPAPAITSNPGTSASVGVQYAYDVVATNPNAGTLSFSLPQAPAGMTIDAASGQIRWTPGVAANAPVTVQVSDGKSATPAVQSFAVEAKEVVIPGLTVGNQTPPDLVCPPNQSTAASSGSAAVVNYPPPVFNPLRSVACTPASGSAFPAGASTVTCATQDALEPAGSCSFRVDVALPAIQPVIVIGLTPPNDADVGVGFACYDGYGDVISTIDGTADPSTLNGGVVVVTPGGQVPVQTIQRSGGTASFQLSPPLTSTTCSPSVQAPGTGTLVVTNFGGGVARNVHLDITIPYGVTQVAIQSSRGSCADAVGVLSRLGKIIRCEFGDLNPKDRVFLPIGYDFDSSKILPASPITVTSDTVDPNQQNNALTFSPPTRAESSFITVCPWGKDSKGKCKPDPSAAKKCNNKFKGTFAALLDTCGAPQIVVQIVSAVITGVATILTAGALVGLQVGTLTMSGSRIFISAAAGAGAWR